MHRKITLIVGLFLLFCGTLMAQMSDEQVVREAKKHQEAGMSQSQIFQELTRKGVTTSQLQRIRAQMSSQSIPSSSTEQEATTQGTRTDAFDSGTFVNRREPDPQDALPAHQRVYGHDFFTRSNLTFAPNMNMPTPANYVLGPGDEIIIDVWGDSELNLKYAITPDGYITVPGLGRIEVSGMTVERATARIRNQFATIYSDLDSATPHTFLGVSVGNTRTIKVNVMGEVVQPGTYTLTSFASAFHALYAAGGPNRIGSLRTIQVFRDGKAIRTIDLYEYLMDGNSMSDITLTDGDIIKVNPYGVLAQITGQVKRPMKYEMRVDETLSDLVRYAGGFAGKAYKSNVLVNRHGDTGMESFTVSDSHYAVFGLHDGDVVEVGDILDKYSNAVTIEGAVNRPGKYAIGEELITLKDLINIAQGTTGDAYLYRALLYREKEDLTRTVESIDLVALMGDKISDITLRKNDRLFVPSIMGLMETFTVYVGGEVRNPGEFTYAENLSVEDIILRAGGLNESASTARVDVYRRIKRPGSTIATAENSEVFVFSLEDGLMTTEIKSFTLEPYDQVVVRRSPNYETQQNIYVEGEVLFKGQYAKQYKDERLSSFIERAGGLTDFAYVKGARLSRRLTAAERARTMKALEASVKIERDSTFLEEGPDLSTQYVGIDLEKAMKNPGGEDDIILREGDVLTVPSFVGTVKVSGGVLYPNTITYKKGMNLNAYIKQAGGYSRLAMKGKPYVVYMNGKVAIGRRAKIEPGCEIVVPEKPDREPLSTGAVVSLSTTIASTLATLTLLIINVFK